MISLTVLYDNHPGAPGCEADWGFACLVETDRSRLLFDTGANASILRKNMTAMGIDPAGIGAVVLSHNHWDHIGGLPALACGARRLDVFAAPDFAASGRVDDPTCLRWISVTEDTEVAEGVRTTGPLGTRIIEQSLVLQGKSGLVVLTGCAHPGVTAIVSHARERGEVSHVIGGFHLKDMSAEERRSVIGELQALGVQYAHPCHCTGDAAIEDFRRAFGERCDPIGVGSRIELD